MAENAELFIWFENLRRTDIARVGGKNASLGELISKLSPCGVRVPDGFATTADAYWRFVDHSGLRGMIASTLADLDSGRLRTRPRALPGAWIERRVHG